MDSSDNNWTLLLFLMVFGLFQNQDKNRIHFWSDPNQSTAAKSIVPYFSAESEGK